MPKIEALQLLDAWCKTNYGKLDPEDILKTVAALYAIAPAQLAQPSRKARMADARRCFTWFCRKLTDVPYYWIASKTGRSYPAVRKQFLSAESLLDVGDEELSVQIVAISLHLKKLYEEVQVQTEI